jgi:hypothetical protein
LHHRLRGGLKQRFPKRLFQLCHAEDAEAIILGEAHSRERIVLDKMDAFDGLERLIMICVGLDAVLDRKTLQTRSQLYRATTRANVGSLASNRACRFL